MMPAVNDLNLGLIGNSTFGALIDRQGRVAWACFPRFRIRLRPAHAYNAERPQWTRGSNHVRYVAPHMTLRCTTDAPVALGRHQEARELFENMLECRNHLGLLFEDIDPDNGELWGDFPQTYSMVGLINSAMRLSKSWREAF